MKDLHNHIFSNTTCISKGIMLKYINKQLSKSELHEVETHMLDCELCTDAYEGLAYAENSSILFAIDSEIDKRSGTKVVKAPIMRNLMVAASILVLVFGTYFTAIFFNDTINKNGNLALNESVEGNKQKQLESIMSHSTGEVDLEEVEAKNELNNEIEENKVKVERSVLAEQIVEIQQEDDMEEEIAEMMIVSDAEVFSDEVMEDEVALEPAMKVESRNENALAETFYANKFVAEEEPAIEKFEEIMVSSEKSSRMKTERKRGKAKKSVASAPAVAESARMSNEALKDKNQNILVIADYKLVNYLDEYQESYDSEKGMTPEMNSVSAGFENKNDKVILESAKEEVIVEVTYKATLERAIHLYKNQKYQKSLAEFDVILEKHPNDVNAQFYSGLCFYYLGQNASAMKKFNQVLTNKETEFNEEANWHKALTLIKMKNISTAKQLLKSIVQKNGFYKVKAEEKLKGL